MNNDTYLRDHLAADRTILANERTILAYIRTALALMVTGVTFIKFLDLVVFEIIGWVFIPASLASIAIGLHRYLFLYIAAIEQNSQLKGQPREY